MLERQRRMATTPMVRPESIQLDSTSAETLDPVPAADAPLKNPTAKLGEILVEEGVISSSQLNEALLHKEKEGGFLGQALVDLQIIDQNTLTTFLVKQCKIPHLSLSEYDIDPDTVAIAPRELCEKHGLLPLDRMGKILTVAMVDPLDEEALEAVRAVAPDLRIKPIHCTGNDFTRAFRELFPDSQPAPTAEEMDLAGFDLPAGGLKSKKAKPMVEAHAQHRGIMDPLMDQIPQFAPNPMPSIGPAVSLEQFQEISSLLARIADSVSYDAEPSKYAIYDLAGGEPSAPVADHYQFENFAAGGVNGQTVAMVEQQADGTLGSGQMLLVGPPSSGKTHLAVAFGRSIIEQNPIARVGYVSCHGWARSDGSVDAGYVASGWDAFVIDDVHAVAGNRQPQQALLALISSLQDRNIRTIITSTHPLDAIENIEPQLLSRLHGGMTATLAPADADARAEVAAQFCARKKLDVPADVTRHVAKGVTGDVRKLFGALLYVAAAGEMGDGVMSVTAADEILNQMGNSTISE